MSNTLKLILYVILPAYAAAFAMAYLVRRTNRQPVLSILPDKPKVAARLENLRGHGGVNLGPLGCLVFLPLLLVFAALSYPYAVIASMIAKRQEARFLERMRVAGRTMKWEETRHRLSEAQPGTLLCEVLRMHGPRRFWWTPDSVATMSPFPFHHSTNRDSHWTAARFRDFGEWCRTRYTDESSGSAILVEQPNVERDVFLKQVQELGCLNVYWKKPWRVARRGAL